MIVYQAYNKISNMFYIGKTTKSLSARIRQHYNAAACFGKTYFHKALKEYNPDTFNWAVISEHDNANECNEAEIFWIGILKKCEHKVYNLTDGGDGGSRAGEMNPRYGIKMPLEVKKKISNSLKEYYKSHDNPMKGVPSPMTGKLHTQETKQKISKRIKGKKRLDMVGKKNISARSIYCITTDEYFECAKYAVQKYNSDLSDIIKCCKGKNKTVKGKEYKYVEPGVYGWEVE